jgi:hypothetical protein
VPVLATIATINFLFRSGAEDVSFLDPEALRARCMDVIEDADTRERAVQLTGELQRLARRYEDAVTATLDAYLAESVTWESSANGLIKQLEPMDSVRVRTLQEIVRVRQSMLEMLTVEQWNLVFR